MTDRTRILSTLTGAELQEHRANGGRQYRPGPQSKAHRRATDLIAEAWSVMESEVSPETRRKALELLNEARSLLVDQ